jgi:N-methylhydantoinase B
MDIGAMSPGGNSPAATEIFHEGVRIPGVKLVDRGTLRRDVFDMIINMTRQPVMVGLDLKCELAANHVAKERVGEFVERYGVELLAEAASEMMRHSESVIRRRIAEISDGVWQDTAVIHGKNKWKIQLTLRKQSDRLCFDFTGTDPQANTGINLPYHATYGVCFWAVLSTLGYDIPKNHGGFRPIEVIAPEGTVVNVTYPGPVSLNTTSGMSSVKYLTRSVLNRMVATSESWKGEVIANNLGARRVRHAGINQHGQYYVSTLLELDGHGATSTRDGINSGGGLTCHNVEWVELNFPLLYLFRRHIKDAAGAGRFRGGTGAEALIKIHDAPKGLIRGVAFGVAGLRNSGQGVCGGYPGAPSVLILQKQTNIEDWLKNGKVVETLTQVGGDGELLPYCDFEFRQEDVLYMRMASGGGYGDPLERSPRLVFRDVEDHLISLEAAREIYGVVFEEGVGDVDNVRTQQRRAELRELRHPKEVI